MRWDEMRGEGEGVRVCVAEELLDWLLWGKKKKKKKAGKGMGNERWDLKVDF